MDGMVSPIPASVSVGHDREPVSPRDLQAMSAHAMRQKLDLYDLAPVACCSVSEQGLITHANIATGILLGIDSSDLPGRPVSRFVLQPDQEVLHLLWQQAITPGAPVSGELQMARHDGSPFRAHFVAATSKGADGVPALQLVLTDITARRQSEQKQRDSADRYHELFNAMDEGFCIIEVIFDAHARALDYRFLEVNPSFEKQSGLHDVVGRRVREITPELEDHWFEIYGKVALTGKPVRFVSQSKALGSWLEIYAARLGGAKSRKVAVIFNNITEKREAEADRKLLDQALLDKNDELANSKAVAEKANRAKSDFLSHMSHELRTPLSAILGFAQLLEVGSPLPTPSQKRSVQQILQAGWYLLELINEILDLALIESGNLVVLPEPLSLREVLHECEALVEHQARNCGISMTFADPDVTYQVNADRTRLKQVLVNLLSNAIKYNRRGGTVSVQCTTMIAGSIRISVRDTGQGLSPDEIKQLFQPFNRLGQQANNQQGTGIGLVVAKQLIELMGGVIGMHSTVGKGSVFWIEIGLTTGCHARPLPDRPATATVGQASTGSTPRLHTLLYIEDNPASLMLVKGVIAQRPDFQLLSATDASSGIDMARTCLPDVILIDVNLPGISGSTALQILREDPLTSHIPVMALSANATPYDIKRGLAAGFFRYLTKPVRIEELMSTVDESLTYTQATPHASARHRQA